MPYSYLISPSDLTPLESFQLLNFPVGVAHLEHAHVLLNVDFDGLLLLDYLDLVIYILSVLVEVEQSLDLLLQEVREFW